MTPQARAAIQRQQRQSKTISIALALLGTATVACLMGFLFNTPNGPCGCHGAYTYIPQPPICTLPTPRPIVFITPPRTPTNLPTNPLVAPRPAEVRIPVVDIGNLETSFFSHDVDFDRGMGNDEGMNQGFVPAVCRKRCSKADRLELLEQGGGAAEVDETVIHALRYLKSTQARDGSWGNQHKSAMTGLALLAYLGHCETVLSAEFGDSCLRAITYLVDLGMKHDGRIVTDTNARHWPYEQAIATYALAEAHTFHQALAIDIPMLRKTVADAGQLIIDGQHPSGGWDYNYDESSIRGGDLSITGWHLQALKACKLTSIDFRNLRSCARKALSYVEERQGSDGGFGYVGTQATDKAAGASLTGVGMLSLQIWGQGADPAVRRGAKHAHSKLKFDWDSPSCDLYAHYYLSQALFQHGGAEWESYQSSVLTELPKHQAADGSWPIPGGGRKPQAVGALFAEDTMEGRHYRTALATLMLEVYYRYLPATR